MNLQDNAERIKYFDKLLNIGIINLYTLSKEDNTIKISGFDSQDNLCLIMMKIAGLLNTLRPENNYKLELKTSLWQYLKYIRNDKTFKGKRKWISIRNKKFEGINPYEFLSHISKANNESINIFEDIYDEYYGKGVS